MGNSSKAAKAPRLAVGTPVQWNTPQGPTTGRVTRQVKGTARAGGHVAKATPEEPQVEVRSDKSGKTAIHRPAALKKVGR